MKSQLFLYLFFLPLLMYASDPIDPDKKALQASVTQEVPIIDGVLDDPAWLTALPASDFIQNRPAPGQPANVRTEVRILYNDVGIYVGAMMYDDDPSQIQKELSERDNLANTDWFGIVIDAYRDGINGFGFIVSASNVQFDTKYSTFGEDEGWDAVWQSKVNINSEGWVAEMMIPYSALRFPETEEQTWHMNFVRSTAKTQEKSFWNEVDPQVAGFLNQAGYLTGLKNIASPVRLQATPFVAVYGQQYRDASAEKVNTYGHSFSGGMDVKWGLSDAFTLDMTLIPDFGEAQSDNQVLNLSPFEVRFNENRPFFTEGTELFNKGGLFYSRRIGGRPVDYYTVFDNYDEDNILSNPQQSQLFNATKISGRTAKGLGVGFFNATSGETYARVIDEELGEMNILTDPLTNYNVLVLDQNLPNNSYATLINTTVIRDGDAYDANVTGTDFLLRNKSNTYSIGGRAALSQKYFPGQTDLGHTAALRLRKTSGKIQAGLNYTEESDTYDPNDLGFLFNNNERSFGGFLEYNQFEPFGRFNRAGGGLFAGYNRLYQPNVYTSWRLNTWIFAESKSFWNYNIWINVSPSKNYDYFEPREEGRVWQLPSSGRAGFWVGSDRRKRVRISMDANYWTATEDQWRNVNGEINLRFRVNDRLNFNLGVEESYQNNDAGYVNSAEVEVVDPVTGATSIENEIYFGRRDRKTIETFFRANYAFDANMTLGCRMRHYWSTVEYKRFHLLNEKGALVDTDYTGDHNNDFDAFNIDLVYRWRFAPGSDIFVVWKNSLFSEAGEVSPDYFRNLDGLFQAPQSNSVSIKVIYFLDYASLARR